MRLELVEFGAVDQPRDHFLDVIGRAHIIGDERVEIVRVVFRRARVFDTGVKPRGCGDLVQPAGGPRLRGGAVGDYVSNNRQRVLVILRKVIDHARFSGVQIAAAQILGGDFLARCGLHQRRAGEEDRALIAHDHALVRHGGNISAARGARPHHAGNLRDAERAHIGLIEEDPPEVVAVGEDLRLMRQVRTAGVHQIDARQAVLLRNLLRAQVLLHRHRVIGAALHGRVIAHDHALPPRNAPHPADDRCAADVAFIHPVGCELPDFEERRTRIEQPLHAFTGEQLAARDMAFAMLLRPAKRGFSHGGAQLLRQRVVVGEASLGLRAFAVEFGGENGGGHSRWPLFSNSARQTGLLTRAAETGS